MSNALQIRSRRRLASVHRAEVSRRTAGIAAAEVTGHRALQDEFAQLRREHNDLQRSLFEAAQVQRRMCGPRLQRWAPFAVATEIFPVRHLSGDFLSVFEADGKVVFAIGDIAGKGLPAGMWFTHLISLVRLRFAEEREPAATMAAVNCDLMNGGTASPLATVFLGEFNPKSGEATYCNAGHPPAALLRASGAIEQLRSGGPVLGALAGTAFLNGKATLEPGDTLLGYSDGITECRNAGGEEFGAEKLLDAARAARHAGAAATLFSVLGAVEDFAGDYPREDDLALIVVHRNAD